MQDEGRTLRILIGELDSALRASIAFSLSQAGHEVQAVSEEASVLSFLKQGSIDIALLDLHIAKPDAIELCRTIRRSSGIPIMILAARESEEDLVASLEAGADDFLRKPFSPRTLVARVHALARRAQSALVTTITVGSLHVDLEQHTLRIGDNTEVYLTPLELKALQVLIATPGRTVTSERLLAHLWGHESPRERHTLKQLIYRLRGKLDEVSAADILQTTPGAGYRLIV
jgi:two-component system, OmpR family, response regulator MtrA